MYCAFCTNLQNVLNMNTIYCMCMIYMSNMLYKVGEYMVSEKKRKSNNKYDASHYKIITGLAMLQDMPYYNDYATRYGISMSKLITSCINYCINNNIDITGGIKLNQSGADTISDIQDDTSDK